MTATWDPDELARISAAEELLIGTTRADGTFRGWTPIWVVCADDQVFVRTWRRRNSGWFGDALRSRVARIRVPGVDAAITVTDIGTSTAAVRRSIDVVYRAKYGEAGGGSMVTDSSADATLRLDRRDGEG